MNDKIQPKINPEMTLRDYYNNLGTIQKNFRQVLSDELGVSEASVYRLYKRRSGAG